MWQLCVDRGSADPFTAGMRLFYYVGLVVLLCGCARGKAARQDGSSTSLLVTPEAALVGKVIRFNPEARFVVVNFPIGRMPAVERRMSVYRGGLKVGEVKITGPQREDNIVGDLVAGEAKTGDEIRYP